MKLIYVVDKPYSFCQSLCNVICNSGYTCQVIRCPEICVTTQFKLILLLIALLKRELYLARVSYDYIILEGDITSTLQRHYKPGFITQLLYTAVGIHLDTLMNSIRTIQDNSIVLLGSSDIANLYDSYGDELIMVEDTSPEATLALILAI